MEFTGVHLAGRHVDTRWDLCCEKGTISSLTGYGSVLSKNQLEQRTLSPSLCHPHIHLDKAFLLQHPKYADLEIQTGDFAEALSLTSEAKSRFAHEDLLERGRALIEESIGFGVTHMRAFVEVDEGVQMKCLDAGLALKEEFQNRCYIQICVFAQDPVFSYEDKGNAMTRLLKEAVVKPGVEAFGSTPYVEKTRAEEVHNIKWTLALALEHKLHVDFHLDYNLDPKKEAFVFTAVQSAKEQGWPTSKKATDFRTIVFGHCTRLTLFSREEWQTLRKEIGELPVSFIGLPTSDLFMMARPEKDVGGGLRARGTMQVVQMIEEYGLNAAIGINNVGNAFTPQGSCDPLALSSLGVGIYQAGTKASAEILFQCVSSRAKSAIGLGSSHDSHLRLGDAADFVVFGNDSVNGSFRSRKTIQDLVYDAGADRTTVFEGKVIRRS